MKKLIVELDSALKTKFIKKCFEIDKTQKEVVSNLINNWLRRNGKGAKHNGK